MLLGTDTDDEIGPSLDKPETLLAGDKIELIDRSLALSEKTANNLEAARAFLK